MPEKWFFVINPAANRGNGSKCVPPIRRWLTEKGIDHEILVTTQSSEAMPYVIERAGTHDLIVAGGGDGTVHEVVNGLMLAREKKGTLKAALGVLPIGSGNDFVKMLGIPKPLESALELLLRKKIKPVDIGRINVDGNHSRYFDNNVGIGFDAFVNYESIQIKSLRGTAIYLAAVLKSLFKYEHPDVKITINGENLNKKILLMTTGNGRCSGGGFYVTPDAKIDDGVFDVCVIDTRGKTRMLLDLSKVMKGDHTNLPGVRVFRTTQVTIASETPLPIHADGEVVSMDARRVEMQIIPSAIQAVYNPI